MSLFARLFGRGKSKAPEAPKRPQRDIPEGMLTSTVILSCDPNAADPERRFTVGSWGLKIADDEESQRLARGVLKRNAGKTLRLDPEADGGHRGVIPTKPSEGTNYGWITVDANLRDGTISFQRGQS